MTSTSPARSDLALAVERRSPIVLHIERLVIDGIELGSARQLQLSIERELTRLLRRSVMQSESAAIYELSAPAIELASPIKSDDVGRQIAGSIYQSLRRVDSQSENAR